MEFVKVRHADGRDADITPAEVPFYRSIGFEPVDGEASAIVPGVLASGSAGPAAPANGTDQRLDLVLAELRGLRADLASICAPAEQLSEPIEGATVELREPKAPLNLEAMSREQLNAHAASVGIEDPAAFPNKPGLIEAIRAATSPNP